MDSIEKCVTYSDNIINQLREKFTSLGENKSICILTTGSFARKDASGKSLTWIIILLIPAHTKTL